MTKLFDWTNEQWQEYSDYILAGDIKKSNNFYFLNKISELKDHLRKWNDRQDFIIKCLEDYQSYVENSKSEGENALNLATDEDNKIIIQGDIEKYQELLDKIVETLQAITENYLLEESDSESYYSETESEREEQPQILLDLNAKKVKLVSSIQDRLDKYTIIGLDGWDAEEEYEKIGTKGGVGYHWGGINNPRGSTWRDYVNYINKDNNSNDYTNYKTVEGSLEYALTETLLPHFIELNQVKKMRRREILKYVHKYIEKVDGTAINDNALVFYNQKINELEPDSETYKRVIESLDYK